MSEILTHEEIGKRLGLSKERVRQLEKRALSKLLFLAKDWADFDVEGNPHESQYDKAKRLGMCTRCHSEIAAAGATTCIGCAQKNNERQRQIRSKTRL